MTITNHFLISISLLTFLNPLFILLRIDASGMLEIAAEIGGGGETELESGLLHRLFGVCIHDKLRMRRNAVCDFFALFFVD